MKDEPTQRNKLEALRNDLLLKRGVAAYADVVDLYDDTRPHGRFAVGARQPVTEYPRQPETSPWHHDPVGLEPPLGYSVETMEPVGEPHEVADSLKQLEAATLLTPTSPCFSAKDAGAASPSFKRRV